MRRRLKNIARVDEASRPGHGAWHGYRVRLVWNGTTRRRRFSDSEYGGIAAALAAAVDWRDEQEALMKKPRSEKWIRGK